MIEQRQQLQSIIREQVVISGYSESTTTAVATSNEEQGAWIFDFRAILLNPTYLTLATDVLWEYIKDRDHVQIGGMESASIPLVTSLVLKAHAAGKVVNGFYIRKSRKKSGLYKNIEGTLTDDPVILVDDVMNSSGSLMRQIAVLEAAGKQVEAVCVFVRYRPVAHYTQLIERNIAIKHIFTLNDFNLALSPTQQPVWNPFPVAWKFAFGAPPSKHVVSQSVPLVHGDYVYYGTTNGYFWCLHVATGAVKWQFRTGLDTEGKHLFSSPVIHSGVVYIGSYDGKLYALDAGTGAVRWVYAECEWIGSSPTIAADLGLLFIGLEHGLPGRRGSVVAVNYVTGERVWEYDTAALTHATPRYLPMHEQVAVGGNEGMCTLLDARTGRVVWKFETEGGRQYDGVSGFSPGDIKLAPGYHAQRDLLAFGSVDGHVYIINREDGTCQYRFAVEYYDTNVRHGVWCSPVFYDDLVIFTSTDKHVYAYDVTSGALVWRRPTAGRIFATPTVHNGLVYIGSNDGRLYELRASDGTIVSRTQFPERITTQVVIHDDLLIVPLHSNELYAFTHTVHHDA